MCWKFDSLELLQFDIDKLPQTKYTGYTIIH